MRTRKIAKRTNKQMQQNRTKNKKLQNSKANASSCAMLAKQNNLMDWMGWKRAKHLGGIQKQKSFLMARARAKAKKERERGRSWRDLPLKGRWRLWKLLNWVFMYLVGSFFFIFPPPFHSKEEEKKKQKQKSTLTLFSVWKNSKKKRKSFLLPDWKRERKARTTKDERKTNKVSFNVVWSDGEGNGKRRWFFEEKLFFEFFKNRLEISSIYFSSKIKFY